jgi:single-strand DNA-binding protein
MDCGRRLETRKWTDQDGQERYTTEVVLRPYSGELILLDARKDEPAAEAGHGPSDEPPPSSPAQGKAEVAKPAPAAAMKKQQK